MNKQLNEVLFNKELMEKYRFENLITLFLQGLDEFTGGSLHCKLGFNILSYNRKNSLPIICINGIKGKRDSYAYLD